MASANSANNSSAINLQNELTLQDINEIRSERLATDNIELEIALFLGGYTDNPKQIDIIQTFLNRNPNTILIIFDGESKGFVMMEALHPDYKDRIFFICGDIYDIKIWKLFKTNNFFFNKIIVDFSVINDFDKIHTKPHIDQLFSYLYDLLKNDGFLFMYTNYHVLSEHQKTFLFKIKYKHHKFEIIKFIEPVRYIEEYPIININTAGQPITLCLKKLIPKRELNGGSKQKNKLKTKRKSKSGSRTKRKSKSKSKSKN